MIGDPFGFLNLNKPLGVTSHDAVDQARRAARASGFRSLKVGHAGTLDPLATGVLVLCIGSATRLSEYVMGADKRYRAVVHLGTETDTYDAEGVIVRQQDVSGVTRAQIEAALPAFTGEILQVPPMFSAVKQQGKKLYDLARRGEVVERQPRPVCIDELVIEAWEAPLLTLDIRCSSGTYIRSLAHDLGEALGVGGSLAGLTRTASGSFRIEDAHDPDALFSGDWQAHLIPVSSALAGWERLTLDAASAEALAHGRSILRDEGDQRRAALAYDKRGELIAVVRGIGELWKPEKVFLP